MEVMQRGLELHAIVPGLSRLGVIDRSCYVPALASMRAHRVGNRSRAQSDGLELRSDHGPQYTGADAEALCERWDLLHFFAPVACPTGNAVAERFIQTLEVEFSWTRDFETLAELREAIEAWLESYHHQRPSPSLGWQRPADRSMQNLKRLMRAA